MYSSAPYACMIWHFIMHSDNIHLCLYWHYMDFSLNHFYVTKDRLDFHKMMNECAITTKFVRNHLIQLADTDHPILWYHVMS